MSSIRPGRVFWGEVAPPAHIAQFYENEESFLEVLAGFIAEGLTQNESTIIIATPDHQSGLLRRLESNGVDLARPIREDRYITLDAQTTLSCFMVGNWPDERLFANLVGSLLQRASRHGRRVRAFGEMVALLWAQGSCAATVRLEHLWNDLCQSAHFSLLCSYPKAGCTNDPAKSIAEICAHHSRVLGYDERRPTPAGRVA